MRVFFLSILFSLTTTSLAADPSLLFSLSAEKGFTAATAAEGTADPTYNRDVTIIPDGPAGHKAFQCADTQLLAYKAPGNIFAQRGTLSFFWRSRYAPGPTPFPIFRVGYGDHSSWDMVFLRIDYNGDEGPGPAPPGASKPGFDAFLTDANLSRLRVSTHLDTFPKPTEWTHFALAWDETLGIRFYLNGKLAAEKLQTAVLDAALDQFGPHSRIISPHQVQSDYNFVRGGDLAELRIYDGMLMDTAIAKLAAGTPDGNPVPPPTTDALRTAFIHRYGFDNHPPYYPGPHLSIRKVQILDAYDQKRWWWKATDGIPETTWPGVYNRSRLPGRNDYFQLPDWDCYSTSGKSITFSLPNELCNHLEITGSAAGPMDLLPITAPYDAPQTTPLFTRAKGQQKTFHQFTTPLANQKLRFTNTDQEEPISELNAYYVSTTPEPKGSVVRPYTIAYTTTDDPKIKPLVSYIAGRHTSDEREILVAFADDPNQQVPLILTKGAPLSLVHILIPNDWDNLTDGLDGIALDLPDISAAPGPTGLTSLNIQVKDPLWPMRNMLDFTFSVKPGEPKTLWLDLRDRLLPPGKPLYLTLAAGDGLQPISLHGEHLRLIFKPRSEATKEHEIDRFTQVKDVYAQLVEEHPHSPKLNMWNRFEADLNDLLRVNPDHVLGRQYAAIGMNSPHPPYTQPTPPDGIPLWAFRQTELLKRVSHFVDYYIDNRQLTSGPGEGELGGGLSDDTDLTNTWPGVALMGHQPAKLTASVRKVLEACYNNHMFTNGICTIQADELHSYEEGTNVLSQNLIIDPGNPTNLERAMQNALALDRLTAINPAGHRHIRSSYFSGTRLAEDFPWDCSKPYSYLILQPAQLLVDYNGNPHAKKILLELADGLLAHRKLDPKTGKYSLPEAIHFQSDQEDASSRSFFPWHLFWAAYTWTHDKKYLDPILDIGPTALTAVNANALDMLNLRDTWNTLSSNAPRISPAPRPTAFRNSSALHTAWQLSGNLKNLEDMYAQQIEQCDLLDYINTEGSLWIDRVAVPYTDLQRARLGGIALVRNGLFPGHVVSWKFQSPATENSLAILIPDATPTAFTVTVLNLEKFPVTATISGAQIDPGVWQIEQRTMAETIGVPMRMKNFERGSSVSFTIPVSFTTPPQPASIISFKLQTPTTPYWQRTDLALSPEDLSIKPDSLTATIHNLSSLDSPATTLTLLDRTGTPIASAPIPPIPAPLDLQPKTQSITLPLPPNTTLKDCTLTIDPENKLQEISKQNNTIHL